MASANFGLSLLSRGVGEETNKGKNRKVEVLLEPEDYFNIRKKGYYLPPLHHQTWAHEEDVSCRPVQVHKTYTTRKGALLLYAEDLALSYPSQHSHRTPRKKSLEAEDSKYFSTMNDLRTAILSYGAKEQSSNVFMGFTNSKINNFNSPRTVRPGFSAKRYLASWSKSWDDSILNYLRSEGHLWDKNIFESDSVLPTMYRRINDDMSHVPLPYRVTRSMLLSPGDMVSYEFYRIRPDDIEYGSGDTPEGNHSPHPPKASPELKISRSGMIAAIARDGNQKPHPVIYSQLEPEEQQMILQKLILQSAAHHNQDQMLAGPGSHPLPLDMGHAIAHLVSENSKNILSGGNAFKLRESTSEEQYSCSTPSESSWPDVAVTLPYTTVVPHHHSSSSAIPTLPPIPIQQSVITDGSPQHRTLTPEKQEIIKLPDINLGSLLTEMQSQHLTEFIKQRVKSDGENYQRSEAGDMSDMDDLRSKGDSDSSKLDKTGPKLRSLMSSGHKEIGLDLSMGSQFSQSFENLGEADEQLITMRGGVLPKNRTESMRSYKGGKSRSSAGSYRAGRDILSGDDETLSIIGSVISAPSFGPAVADAGDLDEGRYPEKNDGEMLIAKDMESREDGEIAHGDDAIKIPSGNVLQASEGSESLIVKEEGELEEERPGEDRPEEVQPEGDRPEGVVRGTDEEAEAEESQDGHGEHAQTEQTVKDDLKEEDGAMNIPASPPPTLEDNYDRDVGGDMLSEMNRAADLEEVTEDGSGVTTPLPDHHNTDINQQLPTTSIGSDLTQEAEVSEKSFPKSKKRPSIPSAAIDSAQSIQDEGEIRSIAEDSFTSDDWAEGDIETDGGPLPLDGGAPAKDTPSVRADEVDMKGHVRDGTRGSACASTRQEYMDCDAHSIGTASISDDSLMANLPGGTQVLSEKSDEIARSRQSESSKVSSLMDRLEEEAAAITKVVLQRPKSGRDLAEDAQFAATLWRERLGQLLQARPPADDTQSMITRRRKNSMDGSSVASSYIGRWEGPDLLTGIERQSRRQRRVSSAQATVDLSNPSNSSGPVSGHQQSSSPTHGHSSGSAHSRLSDKPATTARSARSLQRELSPSGGEIPAAGGDSLQLDVTNFGVVDKPAGTREQSRASESTEDSGLQTVVADSELLSMTPGSLSDGTKSSKSQTSDDKSRKKSGTSLKSDKDVDKTKEFIVSMPRDDKEDFLAYKPVEEPDTTLQQEAGKTTIKPVVPKPPRKPKKEKKEKPKRTKNLSMEKKTSLAASAEQTKSDLAPSQEKPENVGDPENKNEDSEEVNKVEYVGGEAEKVEGEEEEPVRESPEFIFIHEEEPVEVEQPSVTDSQDEGPAMSEIGTEYTEESVNLGPGCVSRKQARAAKRAAESERKKKEIEKKRREKEEARRKVQEEQERKERIKLEFEEERQQKEAQIRLKQEAEEEAKRKAEQSQQDRERQAALATEREQKQQEEYKKKMEALAKRKKEEDKLRQELETKKRKEEEERRKEEEEMLAKMAEDERLAYEKQKWEEELLAHIKMEEDRMRREIEAQLAQEEAERLALEMAKRQKELEMRFQFNRELNSEANILAHSQEVTRAFTWSYFELLEYLGIPVPSNMREKYLNGQLLPQNKQKHQEDTE